MSGMEMVLFASMAAKAAGTIAQGINADKMAKFQAKQMREMANRKEAISQREANEERKAARLLSSRAKAIAGASGAGVDDPTVTKILGDIDSQGEYQALLALYDGSMEARADRLQAQAVREEGRQAKRGAYISAIADLGTSMWDSGMFSSGGPLTIKGSAYGRKV